MENKDRNSMKCKMHSLFPELVDKRLIPTTLVNFKILLLPNTW